MTRERLYVVIALIVLGAVLLAVGIIYLTITAPNLPGFIPGHVAHARHARHYSKRGILAIVLAALSFVADAPVVLVACATESSKIMTCGQPAYTVDLSIACSYMILQAWELGLGTCWLAAFREEEVKSILGIPEAVRVVAMTPLGYPERPVSPRPRKRLEEIVCFERYS